eukprot:TRINITY_DN27144_c0_g1_i2.p1 TRINITY_DN27144_c0_g1~~TRINITY_DN27144_c0_g1_i2.p1  ORF type:complete len:563 (-),score=51.27 TRINITY_DN27144_c0_g1_i2:309-1997(-)
MLLSVFLCICLRVASTARVARVPLAWGETCLSPYGLTLEEFTRQCGSGHCRKNEDLTSSVYQLDEQSSLPEYSCVPGTFSNSAVWGQASRSPPNFRKLGFIDNSLMRAMRLSFLISCFDTVDDSKQEQIDIAPTMADRHIAMGIGNGIDFEGMYTLGTSKHFAEYSLRGYESSEDSSWWLDTSGIFAIGVFDGHGGPDVSDDVAYFTMQSLLTRWLVRSSQDIPQGNVADFWALALREMLAAAQQRLRTSVAKTRGGTTASVIVADKDNDVAVVTWLGDSQVLHARRHGAETTWRKQWLSSSHDCVRDNAWIQRGNQTAWCDESNSKKPRVCRGDRHQGRFKTCIGVTRALGDFVQLEAGDILDTPETYVLQVVPGDLVLVASDGLWDVFEVEDVLSILETCERLDPVQEWLLNCANELTQAAKVKWGLLDTRMDDITIIATLVPDYPSASDYMLVESGDSFVGVGGLGDWCKGICSDSMFVNVFDRGKPESTCGDTWVGGAETFHVWKRQSLCCSKSSSKHKYGNCVIPRYGSCDGKESGCISGTTCVRNAFWPGRSCQPS